MGANNCKSAYDMQPVVDDVFMLQYEVIGIHIINSLFWPLGTVLWTYPLWIWLFIMQSTRMFELGAAVDCAIKF